MEYTDKQINSMILYLRINRIAEIQYLDRQVNVVDSGDLTLYDYMSGSHLTMKQVISTSLESGWKEDWKK